MNNGGQISRFSGVLTGGGRRGGLGSGEVVTTFVHGGGTSPPEEEEEDASCTYRGSGDQVCTVPYSAAPFDYTIQLGQARPEVYVIATNTTTGNANPHVVTRATQEAAAKGLSPVTVTEHVWEQEPVRSSAGDPRTALPGKAWVTEFNANPPPLLPAGTNRLAAAAQSEVTVGERYTFRIPDEPDVPATARKVVTDGTTTLVVWVANSQWGTVRQTMVDLVASRFLRVGSGNDIHDWVVAIFGSPWGSHAYSNLIPPDAANRIHILLFDIDSDGAGGTIGYFYSGDNYLETPDIPSNERLTFYIDAPILAEREGPRWEATDWGPSQVVTTLAHEFQHMIHFYQKWITRSVITETWLNEMASEATEDFVADKIMLGGGPRGVAHDDPTAGSRGITTGRLPRYNLHNDIQVTTWNNQLENYSISYALGAYLARGYGGAPLFRAIVQNDGTGTDAVEAALSTLGNSVSFGDVLVNWAVANLLSDDTGAPAPYRYNSGTWSTSRVGTATYRLGSINLFNYRRGSLTGPRFSNLAELSRRTQPPHSNMYADLGRNTGTIGLRITATAGNRITVVIKE